MKRFHHRLEYPEIVATIRHYSALRFQMLSVCYLATAGLFVAVFSVYQHSPFSAESTLIVKVALKVAGLAISLVFWLYDLFIDRYQTIFGKYLRKKFKHSHWNRRGCIRKWFQIPAQMLYIVVGLLWVVSFFL